MVPVNTFKEWKGCPDLRKDRPWKMQSETKGRAGKLVIWEEGHLLVSHKELKQLEEAVSGLYWNAVHNLAWAIVLKYPNVVKELSCWNCGAGHKTWVSNMLNLLLEPSPANKILQNLVISSFFKSAITTNSSNTLLSLFPLHSNLFGD